jgi:YidC/Oxa1 family membrane protein insertase
MQLMQPKSDDPAVQQSNAVLKFLPILIGWFSLSVPAALSVYWVVNNIITTATTLAVKATMPAFDTITPGASGASAATASRSTDSIFAPPREKPAGFGDVPRSVDKNAVKPITAIDAEIVQVDKDADDDEDGDEAEQPTLSSGDSPKKRGGGKKKKKRT